jgi:hypothetical protein
MKGLVHVEMCLNQLWRQDAYPLSQRNVRVMIRAE